jgi:Co/Zn/Cd efflux system component
MHSDSLDSWRHDHVFLGEHHASNERRSWAVVILCTSMMAAEIVGGLLSGSMALVADGSTWGRCWRAIRTTRPDDPAPRHQPQ